MVTDLTHYSNLTLQLLQWELPLIVTDLTHYSNTLDKISDKQEAVMVLKYALAFYEKTTVKFDSDKKNLDEINKLIADLT